MTPAMPTHDPLAVYASEESAAPLRYPAVYAPKPIGEQLQVLREHFPGLLAGFEANALSQRTLPVGAEAWFVIPKPERIAASYNDAVVAILGRIKASRPFYDYCTGDLGPDYLREQPAKAAGIEKMKAQSFGDFFVPAAQFGRRHAGRSIRHARMRFESGEFGLGAFELGTMLLTHPERLTGNRDLWIDCPGDEYAPCAGGEFWRAPLFRSSDGELQFAAGFLDMAHESCGAASAFMA